MNNAAMPTATARPSTSQSGPRFNGSMMDDQCDDVPQHPAAQDREAAHRGDPVALDHPGALSASARRREPRRLRLRIFSVAGRLVRGGRRLRLRLAERWPWATEITAAVTRLQALPSG